MVKSSRGAAVLLLASIFCTACYSLPSYRAHHISFSNPPKLNAWLPAQRELVACETEAAARYMGDFGFFHPQCTQLTGIGPRDYQVTERTLVNLAEGPMWLIKTTHQGKRFFVPLPWHDWM